MCLSYLQVLSSWNVGVSGFYWILYLVLWEFISLACWTFVNLCFCWELCGWLCLSARYSSDFDCNLFAWCYRHWVGAAVMTTRICVAIRSFDKHPLGLPACARRVRLPDTRVLYTVLRSPHVDKKSREQFHMITKKQLLVIDTKANELQKKFFWLKRQRILGAQYEIIFNTKTRLDKGKLQTLLNKETETTPTAELG